MIPARAYLAAGALALAFGAGWLSNGWRLGEQAAELRAAAEHERAEAARLVIAEQQRAAESMAEADRTALEKIHENDRLASCIAAGNGCGLRVKVARSACVPETAAPASVGDRGGEWAELDPGSRHDYLALRARLVTVEQALQLCVGQWPR